MLKLYFNGKEIIPELTSESIGAVPTSRKIDGKTLTGDVNILPSGGTAGQILAKSSSTNYAVKWADMPLSIEEYDETVSDVEWHVRKWSNGFCELMASIPTKEITESSWSNVNSANVLYYVDYATGTSTKLLPVTLKKRFSFNFSVSGDNNIQNGTWCTTSTKYNILKYIPTFCLYRHNAKAGTWVIQIDITGLWK